jgi:hypothetical protein
MIDTELAHPQIAATTPAVEPTTARRPGRPRARRPRGAVDGAPRVEAQTTKAYRLGDDARRTVGYLRLILNQRHVPDDARVVIDGECITIEWLDE